MIQEDLFKTNIPTVPEDLNDPFRFGQLLETVRDAFSSELSSFFNKKSDYFLSRLQEVPTIRKYSLNYDSTEKAAESSIQLVQNHPDILERLPCVAIGVPTGNQKKLGFGSQFVDVVQPGPRLVGSNNLLNPFPIDEGAQLVLETTPDGVNPQTSTFIFTSGLSQNINSVPIQEFVDAINIQSLYVIASIDYSNGQQKVRLSPGKLGRHSPNKIKILDGSSASLLSTIGFTIGQEDTTDNPIYLPANRYQMSGDYVAILDVITEDTNQTREVTDLIQYFLTFELDNRDFTFYGRSIFDESIVGEFFQIVLRDTLSLSTYEVPRGGPEQLDLIFGTRINIPVTIINYLDRKVASPYSFIKASVFEPYLKDMGSTQDIPEGDYGQYDVYGELIS